MSYCTRQNIIDEYKGLTVASSGTPITESILDEWIDQESSYIDARIGLRYVVPVTTGDALVVLKRICIFRVTERVKNKLEVRSNVSQKDSDEKFVQNYVRTPNDDLRDIAKGLLLLTGATLANAKVGISSFNVDCDVEKVFKTTTRQW